MLSCKLESSSNNTAALSPFLVWRAQGQTHEYNAKEQLLEQKTGKCCSASLCEETPSPSAHTHASLGRAPSAAAELQQALNNIFMPHRP